MCSWSVASGFGCIQVACRSLGPLEKGGTVVGIDLKKVNVPSHHCDSRVRTICADVMNLRKDQTRNFSPQGMGFSVVLSDMCPIVSGITTKDAALSCELGKRALSLAIGNSPGKVNLELLDGFEDDKSDNGVLRRGGNIVIKLLESKDTEDFAKFCKHRFRKVSWLRPKATRSCSKEIYLICQGLC
ncbi:uncharacterized protein LOC110037809 isoform X2 [Phalaenopsis equestris]|uniref:uncharacterized protein LOC110037809 isoform X2 n=1 Tax=Phalaenopsis equestris TaxID=78828 RepID=UPI0009E270B6|nr:uncharacterized protein LOC110037809 isoform X2 [Phalaenopsis equestris]